MPDFGWDYPPGAAYDKRAPWNQDEDPPPPRYVCLCVGCENPSRYGDEAPGMCAEHWTWALGLTDTTIQPLEPEGVQERLL